MQFESVKKAVVTSEIINQIQNMVTSGQLQNDDKLPTERELCEQFNVSRTSVREAISALIAKGILEKRRGGTYVCQMDTSVISESMYILISSKQISFEHIMEARAILEMEIAAIAAQRATEAELAILKSLLLCKVDRSVPGFEKTIRHNNMEFHYQLAKSTHNPILEEYFGAIKDILANDPRPIEKILISAKLHEKIYDRVKHRDSEGARIAMKEHLQGAAMRFSDQK